jgi:hypothetical protein
MHAVERGEQSVVAALRLAGADIDRVSDDGMTAMALARGWQRQDVQHSLGQRRTGLDNEPIIRTTIRIRPTTMRLQGDPALFLRWAQVIDRAVDDLRADEWRIRTGIDADEARAFAGRLRNDPQPGARASWHHLDCTADELTAVRQALVELAYGTANVTPAGVSRHEIMDLLDDFERQLRR